MIFVGVNFMGLGFDMRKE